MGREVEGEGWVCVGVGVGGGVVVGLERNVPGSVGRVLLLLLCCCCCSRLR